MKTYLGILAILFSGTIWADSECLKAASDRELIWELERRLYSSGDVQDTTISLSCLCGNEGASDTYVIWVSGEKGPISVLTKEAQKQCKWSTFGSCSIQKPMHQDFNYLQCQCGVDGASDTYKVLGAGRLLGDAYKDAVAQCRWKPVLRHCTQPVTVRAGAAKNVARE